MEIPQTVKIFLASSSELKDDREAFASLVGARNNDWAERGVFLKLVRWEDFLDAMSQTRLQDEYNEAVRGCDIFVMLYHTKVGKYTAEEFETAFRQFQASRKPFIFTYFKAAPVDPDSVDPADLASLRAFKQKLDALGHFHTRYTNVEELQLHFHRQLDKLAANGFIEFRPGDEGNAPGGSHKAEQHGDGAIAQGRHARAVGPGGMLVEGDNRGNMNTGTQTTMHMGGGTYVAGGVYTAGGDFVGRDRNTTTTTTSTGASPRDLEPLFAALLAAVAAHAPAGVRPAAMQQVGLLKAEAVKGGRADDGTVAGIIEGLARLVPGAVGTIVGTFATPILGGLAGPVTKYVLGKLGRDRGD